jgi:hypothetical protein
VTIARARKHVQKHYQHELARLGGFPQRKRPLAKAPDIDRRGRFMSYDKLSARSKATPFRSSTLHASCCRSITASTRAKSATSPRPTREDFLIGMMKVNFLKRLESSVHAFALTMERTIAKIEALERRLQTVPAAQHERHPKSTWKTWTWPTWKTKNCATRWRWARS